MSDRIEKKGEVDLGDQAIVGFAALPDGGMVALSSSQRVLFLNADGTERLRVDGLDFSQAAAPPVIGQAGIVYFAGLSIRYPGYVNVFALNPDGSTRWTYTDTNLVPGPAISPDGSLLYINRTKEKLYVLDAEHGAKRGEISLPAQAPGLTTLPPTVGADGTIYVQTSGQEPDVKNTVANVFAIDPARLFVDNAPFRWHFVAQVNSILYPLDAQPVLTGDAIYLTGLKGRVFIALNQSDGQLRFSLAAPGKILAPP
ncbi:MAG: PQQ-like beta-propeller repeat protein, partial [Caldilineaceae bacterium]|nr:PQQ-like beta-propeller repeat protein [Caldilineaceae bacterium]